MRLRGFITAVALTAFVGAKIAALSPAAARGAAGGFSPVTGAYVRLPPQLRPWPQVTSSDFWRPRHTRRGSSVIRSAAKRTDTGARPARSGADLGRAGH